MEKVDWRYKRTYEGTLFHAIFKNANHIAENVEGIASSNFGRKNTKQKLISSSYRNGIENVYVRFTKFAEKNGQVEINQILEERDSVGQTVFTLALMHSEKIANEIIFRRVPVSTIITGQTGFFTVYQS